MKLSRLRPRPAPHPQTCKHVHVEWILRAREGGDSVDELVCKDCGFRQLMWFYARRGQPAVGYNFAPVKL